MNNIINVLDIETYEESGFVIPYCISFSLENKIFSVYINENDDIIIETIKIIAMKSTKPNVIFFIHNINFDGIIIINALAKNNILFDWFIRKLDIYYIKFSYLGTFFEFRCSYKLIPLPLSYFNTIEFNGKTIFPYKFINKNNLNYVGDIPNENYFNNKEEYFEFKKKSSLFKVKDDTIKYCENDVILTKKVIENILNTLNKNLVKIFWRSYSSPSMAQKIFISFFNTSFITKNIAKSENDFIRQGYYGGRCEVYGNAYDNEIVNYFDFSGMYGQCMLEKFHAGVGKFKLKNLSYNDVGFHTISYISNIDVPVLPYHSSNGKLLFPNGSIIGTFWFEEIILFVKYGGVVVEIISSFIYPKYEYTFKDYINHFNELKKRGHYFKVFAKLMINSLYGGFAMDDEDFFTIITFSDKEYYDISDNTAIISHSKINNCHIINIKKDVRSEDLYNKKKTKWNQHISSRNVSYAAAISSKARIKLYEAFSAVKKDGGRILYSDTDSIFAAYHESRLGKNCGEVRWSESYSDTFFIAPKFYGVIGLNGEDVKIKGVKKKKEIFVQIKNAFIGKQKHITFNNELNFGRKNFIL